MHIHGAHKDFVQMVLAGHTDPNIHVPSLAHACPGNSCLRTKTTKRASDNSIECMCPKINGSTPLFAVRKDEDCYCIPSNIFQPSKPGPGMGLRESHRIPVLCWDNNPTKLQVFVNPDSDVSGNASLEHVLWCDMLFDAAGIVPG